MGARFCVPNPNRKVLVSPRVLLHPPTTNYLCAARRETHRPDGVVVPAPLQLYLSSRGIPDPNSLTRGMFFVNLVFCKSLSPIVRLQPPTTNYLCAARRETHRPDWVVVPYESVLAGAGGHVPHPDRAVIAAGHKKLAVGRKCNGTDFIADNFM